MDFANVLKETRKRAGLTQAQMAEHLGVARASLSLYESGKQTPDLKVLDALYRITGEPLEYLMGYTDNYTVETLGVDKEIGLSTESLEALKKSDDFRKMANHLLSNPLADSLFRIMANYNQFSKDYIYDDEDSGEKRCNDVVLEVLMEAHLKEAASILGKIYKSNGKTVLIDGKVTVPKEAYRNISRYIRGEEYHGSQKAHSE